MALKKINNTSEIRTFSEIQKGLENTDYHIFAKLPIKDVIDLSDLPSLRKGDKNFYNFSHFDFVICDKHHLPFFAVEFDGPHHSMYEESKKRDIRKNRICAIAKFPLLRVSDFELESFDSVSLLRFMIYRFVKFKEEFENIKHELDEEFMLLSKEEKESFLPGELPSRYDPHFVFDIRYPFPATTIIKDKLAKEYNLRFDLIRDKNNPLWYTVVPKSQSSGKGDYTYLYSIGIYKGMSKGGRASWTNGKLKNEDVQKLYEDDVRFSIKTELLINEDYDFSDSPYEFSVKNNVQIPIYFSEIPGANMFSIAELFCEYLAYKKLLEWTQKNHHLFLKKG